MTAFRTEIEIRATLEACFDAARDMGLHLASAATTGERIVAGRSEGLLELGESVTFEGRHFGIRLRLTSKITEFNRPHIFVDEMQSGPFKRLKHTHRFEPKDGGTRMIDAFDFESPFGPVGWVADRVFVGPHLRRFMMRRAEMLKAHLESA